jgi:hypothetical protein
MIQLSYMEKTGEKYPYIINLNVLQYIQEEFGTVQEFERQILGMRYERDEEGHIILDKEYKPVCSVVPPSVSAINKVLPVMVWGGMEIEAERKGQPCRKASAREILTECSIMPYEELAALIYEEYGKRFKAKKA